jgi:hypothetical protein
MTKGVPAKKTAPPEVPEARHEDTSRSGLQVSFQPFLRIVDVPALVADPIGESAAGQ